MSEITINSHHYALLVIAEDGFEWKKFKMGKNGRYYQLVNSRWRRLKVVPNR